METFIFRYEKILQLRMDEEEKCRNDLALKLRDLHELIGQMDMLDIKLLEFKETTAAQASNGCTVHVLRTAENERKWLMDVMENQKFLIELKQNDVNDTRLKLGEAAKKRKIMETLKENEYVQFLKESELAEELVTDEIVTFGSVKKQSQ